MLFAKPRRVALGDLCRSLSREVDRLSRDGDRLQAGLGSLAWGSADPTLVEQLQTVDGLVRNLASLSRFLEELASVAPRSATLDIDGPLSRLSLGDLAGRLGRGAPVRRPADLGAPETLPLL